MANLKPLINDEDECNEEIESWDDWEDEETCLIQCLFCLNTFSSLESTLKHCHIQHQFDFQQIKLKYKLDCYGTIRLINFIRSIIIASNDESTAIQKIQLALSTQSQTIFTDDKYLNPIISEDAFIHACLNEFDEEDDFSSDEEEYKNEKTIEPEDEQSILLFKKNQEINQLKQQLEQCTQLVSKFTMEDPKQLIKTPLVDNDTYYFESYAEVGIHRDMICDKVRTDSYMNAMLCNPSLFKDKIVLDVGCGTGILSMFAAKSGASKVIGIDCSDMIHTTRQIIQDNQLDHIITLVHGKVEEVELPIPYVDIIISEWMGYCLLYESMLDSVLHARDKWLKPNGIVLPDQATMFLQGMYDSSERLKFWESVYGFDMKAIQKRIQLNEPFVEIIPSSNIITNRIPLQIINIKNVKYEELNFSTNFILTLTQNSLFHGFVSTFDIDFIDGCSEKSIHFSTGVEVKPTHWKQVFFHISKPFDGKKDHKINGKWFIRRNAKNHRYLDIEIEWKYDDIHYGHEKYTLE